MGVLIFIIYGILQCVHLQWRNTIKIMVIHPPTDLCNNPTINEYNLENKIHEMTLGLS